MSKNCFICKIKFNTFKDYDEHNWEVHQKKPSCDLCGNSYRYRTGVLEHQRIKGHQKLPPGWKPFKCDICDEASMEKVTYNSFIEFCVHNWQIHQITPSFDISGQKIHSFANIEKNKMLHNKSESKQISCDKCDINFTSYRNFDKHNLEVHQIKPSCDICGKSFTFRENVLRHKETHSEQKPSCDICGKTVKSREYLNRHKERHSEQKNIQCQECGEFFGGKYSLYNHIKLKHKTRPEKKYSCTICEKKFAKISEMENHKLIHMKREKSFLCNTCGKGFFTKFSLKNHEKTHTGDRPYPCKMCEKLFKDKHTLDKHIRIHTDERPYSCDVCDKTFRQGGDLIIHKRIHTGEKPYSCELCQKSFCSSSEMAKHKKTTAHLNMLPKIDIDGLDDL